MKKKKIKNYKRFLLLIFIIISLLYTSLKYLKNHSISLFSIAEYKDISQNINANYSGIGMQKIKNKDGYFATFTSKEPNAKTYIEYKQNGNSSWAENEYWGGTMKENGCGITVMAIILSGYGKNYTPEDLRQKYYPVLSYENLSTELSQTFEIKNSDFYYDSVHASNKKIIEHLETNKPIIICVWNKPKENRWTTSSHYMALLATDGNLVYVSNPNRWRK